MRALQSIMLACLLLSGCAGRSSEVQTLPEVAPEIATARAALPEGDAAAQGAWIVSQSWSALGGEATRALKSRVSTSTGTVVNLGMTMKIKTVQLGPDKVYVQQQLAGVEDTIMAFDGQVGWSVMPMLGLRQLEGEELEELRRMGLRYEQDPTLGYKSFVLTDVVVEDGAALYRLELTPEVGEPEVRFIDARSLMPVRSLQVSNTVQGTLKVLTRMDAYMEVDGLRVPERMTVEMGPIVMQTRVVSVEHNVAVDQTLFAMPSR